MYRLATVGRGLPYDVRDSECPSRAYLRSVTLQHDRPPTDQHHPIYSLTHREPGDRSVDTSGSRLRCFAMRRITRHAGKEGGMC